MLMNSARIIFDQLSQIKNIGKFIIGYAKVVHHRRSNENYFWSFYLTVVWIFDKLFALVIFFLDLTVM